MFLRFAVMKIWDNKVTSFLAYSNIWVGLSVAALTWISQHFFGAHNHHYVAFSFFATIAFYGYARFFEGETHQENPSPITKWHKENRTLQWVIIIGALLASIFFFFQLSSTLWVGIVMATLLGGLYPIPYALGKWSGIRHMAGLKLFMIALIWTAITSFLPMVEAGMLSDKQAWIHLFQRFLFVTAITIPFDIRDTQVDHPKIETIPHKFGINRARKIILGLGLLIECSLLVQYFSHALSGWVFLALFIGIEISMVLSYRSYPIKRDLYYSFLIEGSPILMFLLVYIFQYF